MRFWSSAWTIGVCLAGAAWAGGQINVDRIEEHLFCEFLAGDGAIALTEGGSCNGFAGGQNLVAGVGRNQFVPPNRDLLIEDWGLVVTDVLGAVENCHIDLMVDNTPTGAGSSASRITTNDATGVEDDCIEGLNLDLDAAGETCTIPNLNQLIQGGGYFRFEWTEFGVGTCTQFASGAVWVRGRFLP